MSPKKFLVALLLGFVLAAAVLMATRMGAPKEPATAMVLPQPTALPEFSLLDQSGAAVGSDVFKDQWDALFFGFTHCPDVCPTTLQVLASARKQLADAGVDPLPRIVLVSVDPERDTPEIMRQYVDYFGAGNLGVTGELAEIEKLTRALGIFFEKQPSDDENYSVDHSAAVLILNPDGEFHALFSAPHEIANYVHDFPIIMGAR